MYVVPPLHFVLLARRSVYHLLSSEVARYSVSIVVLRSSVWLLLFEETR